jgi:O-antigen ligase
MSFALITIGVVSYPERVIQILSNTEKIEKTSIGTAVPRIIVWSSGFNRFKENPMFGIGPGNIVNVEKAKNNDIINIANESGFYGLNEDNMNDLATHSNYLEILFEQGLIGFIFFLLFIFKILSTAKRLALKNPQFIGFYLALIAFFIGTSSLSYLPHYLFFFIGSLYYFNDSLLEKKLYAKN